MSGISKASMEVTLCMGRVIKVLIEKNMYCEIRCGKGFQRVFVDFNIFATLPSQPVQILTVKS